MGLQSVRETLAASPFLFRPEWAYILSGSDEGVFGWVAVNYLLGALTPQGSADISGVVDLGGGSVQLVYPAMAATIPRAEDVREVAFASHTHSLYARSFSGYGLDEARLRAARILVQDASNGASSALEHPCLPAGHEEQYEKQAFVGSGSYKACEALYARLFEQRHCVDSQCFDFGDAQPALPKTIVGFSYLYDRTKAIGLIDEDPQEFGVSTVSVNDIWSAAAKLCAMPPQEVKSRFTSCEDAKKWANFCGDTVYIAVLLTHGFGIEPTKQLTMANKIGDVELVWTLGAMIAKSASLPQQLNTPVHNSEL